MQQGLLTIAGWTTEAYRPSYIAPVAVCCGDQLHTVGVEVKTWMVCTSLWSSDFGVRGSVPQWCFTVVTVLATIKA